MRAGSADRAHLNVEFVAVTKKLLTDLKQNEKKPQKNNILNYSTNYFTHFSPVISAPTATHMCLALILTWMD